MYSEVHSFYYRVVFYCLNEPQFVHSPVDGHLHLGYFQVFQVLFVMNKAAVSIWVHIFVWTYTLISLGYILRSRIDGYFFN